MNQNYEERMKMILKDPRKRTNLLENKLERDEYRRSCCVKKGGGGGGGGTRETEKKRSTYKDPKKKGKPVKSCMGT